MKSDFYFQKLKPMLNSRQTKISSITTTGRRTVLPSRDASSNELQNNQPWKFQSKICVSSLLKVWKSQLPFLFGLGQSHCKHWCSVHIKKSSADDEPGCCTGFAGAPPWCQFLTGRSPPSSTERKGLRVFIQSKVSMNTLFCSLNFICFLH